MISDNSHRSSASAIFKGLHAAEYHRHMGIFMSITIGNYEHETHNDLLPAQRSARPTNAAVRFAHVVKVSACVGLISSAVHRSHMPVAVEERGGRACLAGPRTPSQTHVYKGNHGALNDGRRSWCSIQASQWPGVHVRRVDAGTSSRIERQQPLSQTPKARKRSI